METGKQGKVIEIAQRTRELPSGLQHENTSPDESVILSALAIPATYGARITGYTIKVPNGNYP
jgi:hypothetical protein